MTSSNTNPTDGLETTLVIIKPDAIQRKLVGRILTRFEERGFQIVGLKMMRIPRETAEHHYAEHKGKPFYEPLVRYMSGWPVIVIALRGKGAISIVRAMMGETFGSRSAPGTIRGDFALSNRFNLVHGSDSAESANRELALFFQPEELHEYRAADMDWVYDVSTGEIV